jgi:hypothetical protein
MVWDGFEDFVAFAEVVFPGFVHVAHGGSRGWGAGLRLERKSLTDLITTLMQGKSRSFMECDALAKFQHAALLVEATYEDVKSIYDDELCTQVHPNAVSGSLDAVEARFGIPVIYTSRYRPLAEEKAASWLSKHFTY